MTTPDLASIVDEQEAEIGRLRAELAVVRRDWQADVGSAIARAQTAEARAARLNTEVGYLLEENEEMGRREMQRAAAARKVAQWVRSEIDAYRLDVEDAHQRRYKAQAERDAARAELAAVVELHAADMAREEAEVKALRDNCVLLQNELSDVRAQCAADVGSAIARAQTAEARAEQYENGRWHSYETVQAIVKECEELRAEAARLRSALLTYADAREMVLRALPASIVNETEELWGVTNTQLVRRALSYLWHCAALRGPAQSEKT